MNAVLEGGCQVPIGALADIEGDTVLLRGLVGRPDGTEVVRGDISGPVSDAATLGEQLAEDLLSRGARPILDELLHG